MSNPAQLTAYMHKTHMPESQLPLEADHYRLISTVGKGSFSKVYKAECIQRDATIPNQVAIKVMDLENVSTSFEDILQATI